MPNIEETLTIISRPSRVPRHLEMVSNLQLHWFPRFDLLLSQHLPYQSPLTEPQPRLVDINDLLPLC